MSNVIEFPQERGPFGATFVGPFPQRWKVSVNGHRVPHLDASVGKDGGVELILDERFGISGTQEEMDKWVWFLANAMAVAAGYTSHGEGCNPRNEYKVQLMRAGPDESVPGPEVQ